MPKCKMCDRPGEYHVQLRCYLPRHLDPNKERPVYLMLDAACAVHKEMADKENMLERLLDMKGLRERIEAQFFHNVKPDWRRSKLRWVKVNSPEALAAFRGVNQRLRADMGDIEELLRSRM